LSRRFSLIDLPCGFLAFVCFGDLSPMVCAPSSETRAAPCAGRYAGGDGSRRVVDAR
jgi:hypothetical protein